MSEDERPPEITPWGPKQEEWQDMAGFWWVSTPRHGGIYLTPEQRKDIADLIKPHSSDAEGIWWEEDSAWSLPIVSLLSQRPHGSLSEEEAHVLEQAHDAARDSFPDEWERITGREVKPGESHKREEGREIAAIHSDELLAGTIWRSSSENAWVPEGKVGVAAYPGEAFLDSNMDPARTHAARYFLIPEAEVKWRTPPFKIDAERYQEVTGREGTPPTQAKEVEAERVKSESLAEAAHMSVNYKTPEGDDVTRIYAVGKELVQEDRNIPLKEIVTGRELDQLLQDRGCKLDCSTGPAVVEHRTDGSTCEAYFRDGKLHRENGPARIERQPDGSHYGEYWYRDGQQHNNDGPAVVEREADGSRSEEYWVNGKLHRDGGPAEIEYGPDGFIGYQSYWRDGTQLKDAPQRETEAEAEAKTMSTPAEAERPKPESPSNEPEHKRHRGRGR